MQLITKTKSKLQMQLYAVEEGSFGQAMSLTDPRCLLGSTNIYVGMDSKGKRGVWGAATMEERNRG